MRRILICFCFFLCFQFTIYSQVKDAGLWLSGTAEKNVNGLFSAYINPQFRFNENYSELGSYFLDGGLSYEIKDLNMKVTGSYRFAQKKNLDDSYNIRHRFYADLAYKMKMKKLVFSYRLRYQYQFKDINRSSDWAISSDYLRNKFSLKFKPEEKLRPFVFLDSWFRIKGSPKEFDNIRLGAGFDYELDKRQSISPSFFMDKEFNVNNPYTSFILGIDYSFTF